MIDNIICIITFSGLRECDGEAVDEATALATEPEIFMSLLWGTAVGLVELDETFEDKLWARLIYNLKF